MTAIIQEKPKSVELPAYKEIETHCRIGEQMGGIVELDLKVRIPKNMLRLVAKAIELGYWPSQTVEAELNHKLLFGLGMEIEGYEEYADDFARLVSDPCGLNFTYDFQKDGVIDSIIENKEVP